MVGLDMSLILLPPITPEVAVGVIQRRSSLLFHHRKVVAACMTHEEDTHGEDGKRWKGNRIYGNERRTALEYSLLAFFPLYHDIFHLTINESGAA